MVLALCAWAAARYRPERFEIVDDSMEPTLSDGDYVLALRGRPRLGDIIITNRLDEQRWSVKRIVAGPGDAGLTEGGQGHATATSNTRDALGADEWYLVGDNRARSIDSRHRGPILLGDHERRVVIRYWPQFRLMA